MNTEEIVAKYFGVKDKTMENMLNEYTYEVVNEIVSKQLDRYSNPFDDRKIRHALSNILSEVREKTGQGG